METRHDAIIVGGGPGGLAIGALLARNRLKVLVLEKRPQLGGRYRSIAFKGCRVDNGVHLLTGYVPSIEETFCKKLFEHLGICLEQKEVVWTMGLVGQQAQKTIEFFSIDRRKGVANFFDFFAFGSGMEMQEDTKKELTRVFKIMGEMTLEEKRSLTNTSWAEWLDQNCRDPVGSMILSVQSQLSGCTSTEAAAGAIIGNYAPFSDAGAVPFWYPAKGTLQDCIIAPLARYITESEGEISMHSDVVKIDIERGSVRGVWVRDTTNDTIAKIEAPVVVLASPIHQFVGEAGIIDIGLIPEDWQVTIAEYRKRADPDLTGFYLLRERMIPEDYYGWIHLFDAAAGIPNYVGDWLEGGFVNATVPPGKQLLSTFITANNSLAPFGFTYDFKMVEKALGYWEDAMEKAFPGFRQTIQYKTYSLQLNWGRYALARVPTEIKVRCPSVQGLYFAGDSVHTVGSLASDKVFEVAKVCQEAIVEDRS